MIKLRMVLCAAVVLCFAQTTGGALSLSSAPVAGADRIVQDARVVCDQYGSCWDAGPGYGYEYRPPSKWERKGFCPPGQAKKGNC